MNRCSFFENKNEFVLFDFPNKNIKTMNDNIYCLSNNDTISINIEKIIKKSETNNDDNVYQLYFTKNNQIIGQNECYTAFNFVNGKICLDFGKFYYYYAFGTMKCDCHQYDNTCGIEFEVQM